MKNIVFVIESLHLGGAEKSLVTLLQNLDYSNYKVDLIIFKEGGIFRKYVPKEVNLIQKSFPAFSFLERFKYKTLRLIYGRKNHSAQLLWKVIEDKFDRISFAYDVAIAYNQGFSTYFTDKYISAEKKYAWLNTDYQKAGYNIEFDYPIYRKFNGIVAVSTEAKQGLERELSKIYSSLKIDIIKDITDKPLLLLQSKKQLSVKFDSDKINIVTTGRLAKPKGLHLAIETCKKLQNKGYSVNWYVIGGGSERKNLENMIMENQLENSFFLTGATDNPYPYMRACDIYVQTSLFEGLGLTVIEATYLNKPIVSTNFPSVYGILKDKETGLIAEMNSDSITEKIEMLIQDADLKNKLVYNLGLQENKDKETSLKQFYANI